MKLENDYAIIESLAEWELFYYGEYCGHDLSGEFINAVIDGNYKVSREQVKGKLQFKEEQDFFKFDNQDLHTIYVRLPLYCTGYQTRYIENKDLYLLPVNILTINKSIQELYELGKWCGLWI